MRTKTVVKPLSQKQIKEMTKWLTDLDRATVNRNRESIFYLFEYRDTWDWTAAPETLQEEKDEFIDRANTVIGY